MNKNENPVQKFFFTVTVRTVHLSDFFSNLWNNLSKTIQARKQVNIDKTITVTDMTLPGRWYIGGPLPVKIHNPHISVLHIFCEVKFKFDVQWNIYTVSGSSAIYG